MKKGLVLEGGAMRGLFTAGVIDVFLEQGITFDGAIGVSAGACFGCNYKSGQIGRAIRYNERFCRDKRYCSFHSLMKTGDLFGAEFCYHTIPEELDVFDVEAFHNNPMEFYLTCTDMETGKAVYKPCLPGEDYLEWMRASASMPLAANIVEMENGKYLDGGIADSIPLRQFESMGYEKNVVILTQPPEYRKKKNRLMPLMSLVYKSYPNFLNALANRHHMYNDTLDYIRSQVQKGAVFVIQPTEKLPVGHVEHDKAKLRKTYNLGRKAAEEQLEALRTFLNREY